MNEWKYKRRGIIYIKGNLKIQGYFVYDIFNKEDNQGY